MKSPMTVGELIAQLEKLPRDIPVKIEGYVADGPDCEASGAVFTPNAVEALHNDVIGNFAVVWASIDDA